MTDHGIVAADWQGNTADRLTAIVLPLVPQIETHPDGSFYWPNKLATAWMFDTIEQIIKCSDFPYRVGDRIFLQEEWTSKKTTTVLSGAKLEQSKISTVVKRHPVETMPPEAAQHWFEVIGVGVAQAGTFNYVTMAGTGIYSACPGIDYPGRESVAVWDATYPEHPWSSDLWVVVLDVQPISL
jgi:hypothetical protein